MTQSAQGRKKERADTMGFLFFKKYVERRIKKWGVHPCGADKTRSRMVCKTAIGTNRNGLFVCIRYGAIRNKGAKHQTL